MYGIPKVHTEEVPLRPILSMVNSPQHEIAKWLSELFRPVVDKYSKHTLKDLFEFCRLLEDVVKDKDTDKMFLCSYDITSLFTCVPLERAMDICLRSLYKDKFVPTPPIPESLFRKLLVKSTAGGQIYQKVDGVAMGPPLGPDLLANVYVGLCEEQLAQSELPLFYKRYVDDTFGIVESEQEATDFRTRLNQLDAALQFTAINEQNRE